MMFKDIYKRVDRLYAILQCKPEDFKHRTEYKIMGHTVRDLLYIAKVLEQHRNDEKFLDKALECLEKGQIK